jgi:plastocyanin
MRRATTFPAGRGFAAGLLVVLVALALAGGTAQANVVNVTGSSSSFTPPIVNIQAGDTVVWAVGVLPHTVTNGTGSLDPVAGTLFDSPLDTFNPTVSFTFNTPGSFPYFCRNHELLNMKGTVNVAAPSAADAISRPMPQLSLPHPNPFNPRTALELTMPVAANVRVTIHDLRGRLVAVLADGLLGEGQHTLVWTGSDQDGQAVSSGVYVSQLVVDGQELPTARYRMVLVR